MIRKVIQKLKNFKHYLAYGGITHVTINQVECGKMLEGKRILISGGGYWYWPCDCKKIHS